jgi:hypothetical protein
MVSTDKIEPGMRSIAVKRTLCATSKTAAAALALCLLAGPAAAAALCAQPQDMTALRAAALRQELMVAALSCRAAADFNLFVAAYRDELLKSDRALKDFFLRQDASKGEGAYDAYKTRLANISSLRSLHDPRFCRSAKVAFDVALKRKGALAELESERPTPIATGYAICSPGAAKTEVAVAAPSPPPRRMALLDSTLSVPVPKLAPRPLRASPAVSPLRVAALVAKAAPSPPPPQRVAAVVAKAAPNPPPPQRVSHEFGAYDRLADAQMADYAGERDDFVSDAADERDDAVDDGDDAPRYVPRFAEATPPRAYGNLPDAYKPGAYWVDANEPPVRPRMVRGPGGWYLLLQFGR